MSGVDQTDSRQCGHTRRGSLLDRHGLRPDAIYAESFARIDALLAPLELPDGELDIARRVVHATGDPALASMLRFHPEAIAAGLAAVRARRPIVVDVRMVAVGVNTTWLAEVGCDLFCAIEEPLAETRAVRRGITRSAAAIEELGRRLDDAVVVVGNAPTALLALLDLVDAGAARPALIIGLPVGFVAAAESKDELMRRDTPWISLPGLHGGSAAAAATVNALLRLALDGSTGERQPAVDRATAVDGGLVVMSTLFGFPDDSLARRGPSPNLITKREVRAVALARLGLRRTSVVWDVGTGSGSVGIEAASLASGGRVYGVDRHPEAVAVAEDNARAQGIMNYVVHRGEAPQALAGLPDPDAVFVGGSGGHLPAIIDTIVARLRPSGRVVVALATLEHLHDAVTRLSAHGFSPDITTLNVARSASVGSLTRMEALNPVSLVSGVRGPEEER